MDEEVTCSYFHTLGTLVGPRRKVVKSRATLAYVVEKTCAKRQGTFDGQLPSYPGFLFMSSSVSKLEV